VQPAETGDQVTGMTERVASLELTLTRLNGALETVQHDLQTTRQELTQTRAANEALTQRLAAVEGQIAPGAQAPQIAAPSPDGPSASAAGDPEAEFVAARRLLWDGNYASAETAFGAYIERHGDGARGAESRYFYGKTLLARRAYPEAAQALIAAIRGWPQTEWGPDGVLSLARALHGMSRNPDACNALGELRRRYPRASADVTNRATALRAQAQCAA
jgi:tol-pal system protein YbgF